MFVDAVCFVATRFFLARRETHLEPLFRRVSARPPHPRGQEFVDQILADCRFLTPQQREHVVKKLKKCPSWDAARVSDAALRRVLQAVVKTCPKLLCEDLLAGREDREWTKLSHLVQLLRDLKIDRGIMMGGSSSRPAAIPPGVGTGRSLDGTWGEVSPARVEREDRRMTKLTSYVSSCVRQEGVVDELLYRSMFAAQEQNGFGSLANRGSDAMRIYVARCIPLLVLLSLRPEGVSEAGTSL